MLILIVTVLLSIIARASLQSTDPEIPIVRQFYDINPDGSYSYAYETANKIFAEEQGYLKDSETQVKEGQFQYTSPEGQVIRLVYTADENGFAPQGEHLPTPPPIPLIIQRALAYQEAEDARAKRS